MTPAEIEDRARKVVTDYFRQICRKEVAVTYTTDLAADLGADSLDLIDISFALEEAFDVEISDADAENNRTFGQVVCWLVQTLGAAVPA